MELTVSRISLISKSDIRYSGILHEINSEESTVSLENVRSYGTEGRRGQPEEELPASDQVYEYIVFRGSDVKDLRIEEGPATKENKPPAVPDDPAIVGARARPVGPAGPAGPAGPPGPPNAAPGPNQGGFNPSPFQQPGFFPPPGPGPWGGRGGGPGPGPGPVPDPRFGGMHYPPPGWFPPGQGFPPGPGPWNNFGYPPGPHGPPGPPGAPGLSGAPVAPGAPGAPGQGMRGTPQQDNKPTPIGAGPGAPPGIERPKPAGTPSQGEAAAEQKAVAQPPHGSAPAPTPPVDSKPSVEEVRATAQSLNANGPAKVAHQQKNVPTGPRNNNRVTPAVPFTGAPKAGPSGQPGPQITAAAASIKPSTTGNAPPSAASIRDATQQAKDAVAVAMAKLGNASAAPGQPAANGTGNAMDNLTKKVNEMRVNATRGGPSTRGRGGRGSRGGAAGKIDVPETDFDFQVANAKFNKQDLVKEAVAGSPLGETAPNGSGPDPEAQEVADEPAPAQAYNKTRSFFDNISSESKERSESGGQKPGGREWRGEEQRKNMETFGQGSVDGGYRSYRGRGRGRGRGGPRGGGRGFSRGGGFRPRGGDAPQ
ncbi:Scd6-like Sm domain-containing protein [Apiospora hydei]|uniref:Scd6-like Sm domain-containing protein n=1 Tax=Apiospora hydei TaxID=1337664 RepID=A0ABR1XC21_9PEZI